MGPLWICTEPVFFHPIRADQATASQTSAISSCTMWGTETVFWEGRQHPLKEQRHTTGGQEPCDGRSGKKQGEMWASGRRGCKVAPQTNVSLIQGLKPDAPHTGLHGAWAWRHLHQAALPAPSPGQHLPPFFPSRATWAEEAETKKGEEGDPRVGVSLFFPAPTGGRVGVGWDRRDSGREREGQPGQGH